jgi:penicillin-binding protein 1C
MRRGACCVNCATCGRDPKEADAGTAPAPKKEKDTAVRTTLRAPLQRFALDTLQRHLRELRERHVEDGALVVLDNASGEVLAWVGSSGPLSQAAEVDGVTALRQPGSTLKPLLYGQAIAERRLTAASLIEDSSAQISTASGLYIPQNYDRRFKGPVSARTALAASLNVPAVRTLVMVSPESFARELRAAGLPLRESGDYYGYSLALGSAEVSLLSLTNAYRMLANGGRYGTTTLTVQPTATYSAGGQVEGRHATSIAAAARPARRLHRRRHPLRPERAHPHLRPRQHSVHPLLDGREDRHQQGHARQLGRGLVAALHGGRVGGQRQRRVDVGRERHQRRRAGVGRGDALPARARAEPRARAARGPGRVARRIRPRPRRQPAGGGAQRVVPARHRAAAVRAGHRHGERHRLRAHHRAADGTILAVDPDIPPLRQRVRFESEGRGVQWRIDGKFFARGNTAQWLPWPGRHVIELVDGTGKVVDQRRSKCAARAW